MSGCPNKKNVTTRWRVFKGPIRIPSGSRLWVGVWGVWLSGIVAVVVSSKGNASVSYPAKPHTQTHAPTHPTHTRTPSSPHTHPARYATLPNIMKAKKKPIQQLSPEELGAQLPPEQVATLKVGVHAVLSEWLTAAPVIWLVVCHAHPFSHSTPSHLKPTACASLCLPFPLLCTQSGGGACQAQGRCHGGQCGGAGGQAAQ